MPSFYDWLTTPAGNGTADSGMVWAEFMNPDQVNDSARTLMARLAEWRKDLAGTTSTTGANTAYALTISSQVAAPYPDGLTVWFTADRANPGGGTTLAINGSAAVSLRAKSTVALPENSMLAGQMYCARYRSATNEFIVSGSNAGMIELAPSLLSAQAFGLRVGDPILSFAPAPRSGFVRLTEVVQSLSKTSYPDLNAWAQAIGYPWGSTTTTFALPPAAGYFPRFAGTSTTVDPAGPRIAGTTQTDLIATHAHGGTTSTAGAHSHSITVAGGKFGAGAGATGDLWSSTGDSNNGGAFTKATTSDAGHGHAFSTTTMTGGGTETRSKNVAVHLDILAVPALVSVELIGSIGYVYAFNASSSGGDPGAGRFAFNVAPGSATALYISELDRLGGNNTANFLSWSSSTSGIKGTVRFVKVGAPSVNAEYNVMGTVSDLGAYDYTSLTALSINGTFADGDVFHVFFSRTGDSGASATSHAALSGLTADDHPQYHNDSRGDARYATPASVTSAVSAHVAATDPHPQYQTQAESDALYAAASAPATAAAAAISAHLAAVDPHPLYLTQTEGDARFIRTVNNTGPDASGNVTVTGSGGGVTAHGALTGLTGDDHPQYHNDSRGDARYALTAAPAAAVAAHVAASDPHTQYVRSVNGVSPTAGNVVVTGTSSRQNLLINADFAINQRAYTNGTNIAANTYFLDRWKTSTVALSSPNFSQGLASFQGSTAIVQVIETALFGYSVIAGLVLTASVEAPSVDITVTLTSTNSLTASGTITAGSGRRSVTLTMPAGSTGNITCTIGNNAVYQAFGRPKLEEGSTATDFVMRPQPVEMDLCRRYYRRFGGSPSLVPIALVNTVTPTSGNANFHFTPPLRAAPTYSLEGAIGNLTVTGSFTSALTAAGLSGSFNSTPERMTLALTFATAGTAGQCLQLYGSSTATIIHFTSEL